MSQKLVLVLNCGSSSLKFAVINPDSGHELLNGLAECFNLPDARIKWKLEGAKHDANLPANSAHNEAINFIVEEIIKKLEGGTESFVAVGHRVVTAGESVTKSTLVDDALLEKIKDHSGLAPLHHPAQIMGIKAAQIAFPELPQIAAFDTAFHNTMPQKAFLYAIPHHLYTKDGIRRYGMHGTSHYFVSNEAAKVLNKPVEETCIITAHLGNGASVTAVKGGESVDTSMGMTPLAGLVMGTRSGDLDPGVVEYLVNRKGYTLDGVMNMLQKESGLLGISGLSNDCRVIEEASADGHEGAILALDMFCYRLAKYIASYAVPLGRIDALVFTGGIGENSNLIRAKVLELLSIFGYKVDAELNKAARFGNAGIITAVGTPVAMVIPTNEELVIAQDAAALV